MALVFYLIYKSPSSRGRGLKYIITFICAYLRQVALFTRAWIEISWLYLLCQTHSVALFTRAWIEIAPCVYYQYPTVVALFTRAWIEILSADAAPALRLVALFTRAWIEIISVDASITVCGGRPLHEGVDWNSRQLSVLPTEFCRPLHEGVDWNKVFVIIVYQNISRPLHEGVDWNCVCTGINTPLAASPSSRGRGLKLIFGQL